MTIGIIMEEFNWEELNELEQDLLMENSADKLYYGQKFNQYNPEILVDCFVDGTKDMHELLMRLEFLTDMIRDLAEIGWELTMPVQDGVITTDWRGQGPAPTEYSMFDSTGYDLDGNHVDDMPEIEDDEGE